MIIFFNKLNKSNNDACVKPLILNLIDVHRPVFLSISLLSLDNPFIKLKSSFEVLMSFVPFENFYIHTLSF